ncbi:MAG: hypothetical protein C4519_04600 [Desulfobacteraceae bacterium]|nr:MAG: hypothetical protein C4519_04600 [Desulfobacteraceae bacterium]
MNLSRFIHPAGLSRYEGRMRSEHGKFIISMHLANLPIRIDPASRAFDSAGIRSFCLSLRRTGTIQGQTTTAPVERQSCRIGNPLHRHEHFSIFLARRLVAQ